jgi:REP element-mobilizing transposase RayT
MKRPSLSSRHPVYVSLAVNDDIPSFRGADLLEIIEECLRETRRKNFRVVHYSIQDHHLHFIVEAKNRTELSRGMQGLSIRIARRINKALGRTGKVFVDRYDEMVITTPGQVRAAIQFVLLNARSCGAPRAPDWIDPCSSGRYFDGWRGLPAQRPPDDEEPTVSEPRTWLASRGWRRLGLIPVDGMPGTLKKRS